MTAADRLLARIRKAGITLVVDGGELVCDAEPDVLTPERVETIRKHKVALLELVKAEAVPSPTPTAEVVEIASASRGPCTYCGEPVTWRDGLRNWFGQLTHHRCAGRWKEGRT
jgi:hypothetical protein